MKKFIWLTPLLFALNVVFAGCDERGRQPVAGRAPSPSTAPSTARLSDSELQKAVRAKLETDAQLKEDFEHRPSTRDVDVKKLASAQETKEAPCYEEVHSGEEIKGVVA